MFGGDISQYQLYSVVAECCGGTVTIYSAIDQETGENVAIKRFSVDKAKIDLIQDEVLLVRQLQHPNILPYYNAFVNSLDLYIVTPLMEYGSCRDMINKYYTEGLPELASCIILRDALRGLEYIHKKGYIHRGIRASHILVSSSGSVCLTGLRSAGSLMVQGKRQKVLHSLPPPNHNNSSLVWLSPEVLEQFLLQNLHGYDEKSDIYSIGMVACEFGNGAIPFSQIPSTLMFTEKVQGNAPQLLDCTTFPQESLQDEGEIYDSGVGDSVASGSALHIRQIYANRKFTDQFHHIAELCLQRDPVMRPTVSQLLTHSFFKQIRKGENLSSILHKVEPIRPTSVSDDVTAFLLEEKFAEMDIEPLTDWDF